MSILNCVYFIQIKAVVGARRKHHCHSMRVYRNVLKGVKFFRKIASMGLNSSYRDHEKRQKFSFNYASAAFRRPLLNIGFSQSSLQNSVLGHLHLAATSDMFQVVGPAGRVGLLFLYV